MIYLQKTSNKDFNEKIFYEIFHICKNFLDLSYFNLKRVIQNDQLILVSIHPNKYLTLKNTKA